MKKALENGRLNVERLESYKKLQREMLFEERKGSMTPARAEKLKIIDMMGSLDTYRKVQKYNRKNKGR